jgi:hypothetical protein
MHDQGLYVSEIELVTRQFNHASAHFGGAWRVGATSGHTVSGESKPVTASQGIATAIEGQRHRAFSHAVLEIDESQVIIALAIEHNLLPRGVDAIFDDEGIFAIAGVDGNVIFILATDQLNNVVTRAERHLQLLGQTRTDIQRRALTQF